MKNILIRISPENSLGCIYKVPCGNCDKFHVGQTGKDLSVRFKQHKISKTMRQESNALFNHVKTYDHCIDWNNTISVINSNSITKRNITEPSIIGYT